MNRDEILGIIDKAAGSPTTGNVRDILPTLADALAAALAAEEPETSPRETRLVQPAETR